MSDIFNLSEANEFGAKTQLKSNSQVLMTNMAVNRKQLDDPFMKTTYPVYLYKPPFGYPRNVNVVFLRQLATNPYVFSVIKTITDQAAETDWEIKPKEGVEMNEELEQAQNFIKEFFKNPNSDHESFAQLLRKVIPDILTLDSGVFQKVYNKKKELLQLRVIDGGAILKNPDQFGSIANREDVIFDTGYFGLGAGKGYERQEKVYKLALDKYNAYGYTEHAAYYQFAYGINYSVPIPFGKDELIYMMENPASETVYSRASALQSAVDITLNLIYSSKASLDLFLNANIPSGIIQLAEAAQEDTQAFQDAFYNQQYSGFDEYGFQRKVNGRLPVVGNPNVNFIPLNFNNNDSQIIQIQEWFTKVLWASFGVTAEEMGFTEKSNKAVSESQTKAAARKAVRPRLNMIANYLNDQVMPELPSGDLFEFCFDEYDINEEKAKWELYQMQIATGAMSPQMAAEQEGIDIQRLQKDKEENMSMMQPELPDSNDNEDKPETEQKSELKSTFNLDGGKIVITGENADEILKQAVELAERAQQVKQEEAEEKEEEENKQAAMTDVMYEGAEEQAETEELTAAEEELKSKKMIKPPKKLATEQAIEEFYKEYDKLVRDIIKNA